MIESAILRTTYFPCKLYGKSNAKIKQNKLRKKHKLKHTTGEFIHFNYRRFNFNWVFFVK